MLDLIEYLNKYFKGTTNDLEADFAQKFGVDVKSTPEYPLLRLFKYNMISAKWTRALTHMCRGTICELTTEGEWKIVSYPFDKFFNLHESSCSLNQKDYEAHPENYQLAEKADGTCIQLYSYNGHWYVSTLGTIITLPLCPDGPNFESLFWQTLKRQYQIDKTIFCKRLTELEGGKCTYIFELCTSQNRIVTKYQQDRVYLLGVRELYYGYRLRTSSEVDLVSEQLGIRRPRYLSGYDYPTIEKVKNLVEEEGRSDSINEDVEVEYPEGYIVYQGGIPQAKIKNSRYLALHSVIGGENERCVARRLAEALFEESLDDLLVALSPVHVAAVEHLQETLRELTGSVVYVIADKLSKWLEDFECEPKDQRKHYALKVQELAEHLSGKIHSWVTAYFYRNFDKIQKGFVGDFAGFLKAEVQRTKDNVNVWRDVVLEGMQKYRDQEEVKA